MKVCTNAGGLLTGKYHYEDKDASQPAGRFFGNSWAAAYRDRWGDTMAGSGILAPDHQKSTFVFKLCSFSDRYWKESHFQAIDKVLKTLDTAYGSQKPTLTSAAMRWMYHHSKLQVFAEKTPTALCFSYYLKSEHFNYNVKSC